MLNATCHTHETQESCLDPVRRSGCHARFCHRLGHLWIRPQSGWQSEEKLEKLLADKGWQVRRIKEDGGCWEVYALDDKGQRVEAYFHPVTLASVPAKLR